MMKNAKYNVDGFYITEHVDGKYSVDHVGEIWLENMFVGKGINRMKFDTVESVYDFLLNNDFLNGEEEIYVLDEKLKEAN